MDNNFMNGMFVKLAPGMCRLSMNGEIAVKTNNGYKTYNVKTGRLTNCNNFVFDIGTEFFFVLPTTHAKIGDIILVGGKPKCVIEEEKNKLIVINYEDSTVETIIPERHMFMGNTYFYSKIVSMFGGGKINSKKVMSYMCMSEMMRGSDNTGTTNMGNMLPMMMLMNGGNMSDMFDGMFDDTEDDEIEEE